MTWLTQPELQSHFQETAEDTAEDLMPNSHNFKGWQITVLFRLHDLLSVI